MAAPAKINFKMYQGSTFNESLRWESGKKIYKTITNITQAAPCVVTSTNHGIPDQWRVKITNVGGMKDINSSENYNVATRIDADTIELNSINAVGFAAYTSGGVIEYNEPVDITGYTARMQIREKIESVDFIDEYTTLAGTLVIDDVAHTISIVIPAITTTAYTFSQVVYSLELESPGGVVTPFANGQISLIKEVTR